MREFRKPPPTTAREQHSMVKNEVRSLVVAKLKWIFATPVYTLQCNSAMHAKSATHVLSETM